MHCALFTRIVIPETVSTCKIELQDLFNGWDDPVESAAAQAAAEDTMLSHDAVVLLVPSVVVRDEHCIVIDPAHRDFARIEFGAAAPFTHNGRLIRQRE